MQFEKMYKLFEYTIIKGGLLLYFTNFELYFHDYVFTGQSYVEFRLWENPERKVHIYL